MKQFECFSDIGSVLIGDENWTFAVPNIGGDGTTRVRVYDSEIEFDKDRKAENLHFVSSVQGEFGIFRNDCDFHELRRGNMTRRDAILILNGRYGIYNGFYDVVFVKWEN